MNLLVIIAGIALLFFVLLNPILLIAAVGLVAALLFIDKGAGGNAWQQIYVKVRDWLNQRS